MGERERDILRAVRARVARDSVRGSAKGLLRVGIGDDAAVLAVRRGEELVVTTDFSLEDVHFRRGWHAPEAVGHKCLARGLSDVAAMGARPVAAFVSLAVPRELTRGRRSWVDRFYDGLLALAERWQVPLAGGDLAQSPGGAHARAGADIAVVRAEVDAALLPLGAGATLEDALHGGDDYELLFTADSGARIPRSIAGVPVHRIGCR